MATIHLTDPETEVERENVFVKATGWVVGYDLEESSEHGLGNGFRREKVDHVNYPPHRIEKIDGEVTHHSPPNSGVNTV
jgi:hypothetical protein